MTNLFNRVLPRSLLSSDPRYYQIVVLACLLIYGTGWLDFEVRREHALLILSTVLVTQYLCTRIWKLSSFDSRSPLISGLSLCLLLRTSVPEMAVAAACFSIVSKFLLRLRGKHIFNPTNFGIISLILMTDQVWVSPGQWGNSVLLAFLLACLGGLVVNRSSRTDVTLAFLGFYSALVFGRSWWLGEPMSIPFHRLQNGALLLFSFFMISDPKTTPNHRLGRILFALLVALGAGFVQFALFRTNGLLWSLFLAAPAVPLIDWLLPGARYQWKSRIISLTKGEGYERSQDYYDATAQPGAVLGQRF